MILFLDFDGVLHPSSVYLGKDGPTLKGEGSLFMWADSLANAIAHRTDLQIVLSTNWARHLPYMQVRGYLPPALRSRVIGSTWHRIRTDPAYSYGLQFSYWNDASRYRQVRRWVELYRVTQWVAIDDDAECWDDSDRKHLVQTAPHTGLSDPVALERLAELLESAR